MRKLFKRLLQDRSGVSMAEFALIIPVLFVLAIGVIEAGRLILLTQKLQSGSSVPLRLIRQGSPMFIGLKLQD